jgi:hypothetical protein
MYKLRNFYEGHRTVGEWKGSGRILAGSRQGNVMGTAWCELAFNTAGERHGIVNRP